MFSGKLKIDAPGVFQALKRRGLADHAIGNLEALYETSSKKNDLTESGPTSLRTSGTNFNPRPARLMALALKELPELTTTAIQALLEILAINPKQSSDSQAQAIILIDDLRHAHLNSLAGDIDRVQTLDEQFLASLPTRLRAMLKKAEENARMLSDVRK